MKTRARWYAIAGFAATVAAEGGIGLARVLRPPTEIMQVASLNANAFLACSYRLLRAVYYAPSTVLRALVHHRAADD